jgi:two-component system, NtrC family, sensor kinase
MKSMLKISLFVLLPVFAPAQQSLPDSTQLKIKNASNDSILYRRYTEAAFFFTTINSDSALKYIDLALSLSARNKKWLQHSTTLCNKAELLMNSGRFAASFECLTESFRIAQDPKMETMDWIYDRSITPHIARLWRVAETHYRYASLMSITKNYEQAIFHNKEAIRVGTNSGGSWGLARAAYANMNLGIIYLALKKPDSALVFFETAKQIGKERIKLGNNYGNLIAYEGQCEAMRGDKVKAKQYFYSALQIAKARNYPYNIAKASNELSRFYLAESNKDSSLFYALKMMEQGGEIGTLVTEDLNAGLAFENLFHSYRLRNQNDSAVKYSVLTIHVKDSISKVQLQNMSGFQRVLLEEQQRLQNIEQEKMAYQSKIRTYLLLAGLSIFLLIALILYRNNRRKQKANQLLHKQKIEIQNTLAELKTTQAQLIQSEKMASLGELTAGIAHEIQNPLNFVNNFSEVNKELIGELKEEIKKGNIEEVNAIADDIEANEEKINHHGKRADAIVKGMLQHSQSSSGIKEPTNINALADEYLRLAYHGLRAKDKYFNATLKTAFDETIGNVNIIPQDIGRVILNLITNAFYATNEKQKLGLENYEPTVTVKTLKTPPLGGRGAGIEISVKDNGNGIPKKVLDKIFQPFFTTKPTGQGTGLGLSLSYDIVKAHGGEIKVESKEGEGSTFIILLPFKESI